MNVTVYVFSKLNGKYSQYPDDYTRELFDKFQSMSGAGAKMVIHRDGDLMYYGYIRQLTRKEDYMGFCILLNGVMLTQMEQLASLFEKAYKEANVFFTVEMAESVSAMIKEGVEQMECEALPPMAYGISNDEKAVFADARNSDVIVRAAAKYPYVVVENGGAGIESTGTDAPGVSVAAGQKIQEKKGKGGKDGMSEERTLVITGVIAVLLLFLIVITFPIMSSSKKGDGKRSVNSEFQNMVSTYVPIIITDVEVANYDGDGKYDADYGEVIFSSNSMYLRPKIYYRAVKHPPMDITLKVKLYGPSGKLVLGMPSPSDESYSYKMDIEIHSSGGEIELDGWGRATRGCFRHGYYRFEFWYGDMCLGSKRFLVY